MTETQQSICAWADATFGPPVSDASIAARALHEMAELVTACVYGESPERIGQEAADVVIVLARLGRATKIDVIQAVARPAEGGAASDRFAETAAVATEHLAEAVCSIMLGDSWSARPSIHRLIRDLVFLDACLGINLPAAIDAKMAINRARKWHVDERGHAVHVKEQAPTCQRIVGFSPQRECGDRAAWFFHYDYVSAPSISVLGVVPGRRVSGRTALCEMHATGAERDADPEAWSRVEEAL